MSLVRAIAGNTGRRVVGEHPDWSVVTIDARFAVDSSRVGVTVVADPAAELVAMDVHAQAERVHGLVVVALLRVAVAVATLALKWVGPCVSSPSFLCEPIQTLVTVDSRCPGKLKTIELDLL